MLLVIKNELSTKMAIPSQPFFDLISHFQDNCFKIYLYLYKIIFLNISKQYSYQPDHLLRNLSRLPRTERPTFSYLSLINPSSRVNL